MSRRGASRGAGAVLLLGGRAWQPPRDGFARKSHLTQLLVRVSHPSSPSMGSFWKAGEVLNPLGASKCTVHSKH